MAKTKIKRKKNAAISEIEKAIVKEEVAYEYKEIINEVMSYSSKIDLLKEEIANLKNEAIMYTKTIEELKLENSNLKDVARESEIINKAKINKIDSENKIILENKKVEFSTIIQQLEKSLLDIKVRNENLNKVNQENIKENKNLRNKLSEANNKYRISVANDKKMKSIIQNLENKNKTLIENYSEDLHEIEKKMYLISDDMNTLINENKQYKKVKDKYVALSNSKLGKLTLSYWDIKRGRN